MARTPRPFNLRWLLAVNRSDLPARCKALAVPMAVKYMTRSGPDAGGRIRAKVSTLAADSGEADRTVKRARKELVDAGWLVLVLKGNEARNGKPARGSEYRALFPKDEQPARAYERKPAAEDVEPWPCVDCGKPAVPGTVRCTEHTL